MSGLDARDGNLMTTWRCEAGVGIDDTGPGILILKCGEPAELRRNLMMFEVALCDDCYERIKAARVAEAANRNQAALARLKEETT